MRRVDVGVEDTKDHPKNFVLALDDGINHELLTPVQLCALQTDLLAVHIDEGNLCKCYIGYV